MNILFTICGRAGSKGLKNKNLMEFCDFPLVFYSVSAIDLFLKQNKSINAITVLNTDSQLLMDLFNENLKIPYEVVRRKEALSTDKVPKIEVIKNSYKEISSKLDKKFDLVIDLDITSPLRTASDIKNLVDKYLETKADVVFSVTESRRNPYFNMIKATEKGFERVITTNFNTRQDAPQIFDMNASLYAYSPDYLKTDKGIFDGYCEIIEMFDTAVLDIDSLNDFEMMQVIASHLFNKKPEFSEVRDNIQLISN